MSTEQCHEQNLISTRCTCFNFGEILSEDDVNGGMLQLFCYNLQWATF